MYKTKALIQKTPSDILTLQYILLWYTRKYKKSKTPSITFILYKRRLHVMKQIYIKLIKNE